MSGDGSRQLRALSSPQLSKAYNSPLRDTVKHRV